MCQVQYGSSSACSPVPLSVTLSLAVLHVLRLMASGIETYLQTVTDSKLMQNHSPNDTILFVSLTPGDRAAPQHLISHTSCRAPGAHSKRGGAAHQEDSAAKTNRSIMTQVSQDFECFFFF